MLQVWPLSSLQRVFPYTPAPGRAAGVMLDVALGERCSFQVAVRHPAPRGGRPVAVSAEVAAPAGWTVRLRRVGYVPVRHHNSDTPLELLDGQFPGFTPDPLFEDNALKLPAGETHAFWITLQPGKAAVPGRQRVVVTLNEEGGRPQRVAAHVQLHDVEVKPRRKFQFTQWFYTDALLDFHGCNAWDERFWQVLPNYFRDMATHGQDTIYVPVFTPPLDGVKRPTQLLHVERTGRDQYRFDWRDVKRYVDVARRCGLRYFEWTHLFTQWGVKNALRIYLCQGVDEQLLWPPDTGATSDTYRKFLARFLPELHQFLVTEKLLDRSFFHVSDEPNDAHLEAYRAGRALLRELAPWMKTMDALSHLEFATETDLPVPSVSTALEFVAQGVPCWCYYCCGPRGRFVQRIMDTPMPTIRMNGWLFYRWPFLGFLHWGYNYWYVQGKREKLDPFCESDGRAWPGWAYGDTFMVYPGADGPLDSIRWEVFAESLQDYALLQTRGVPRDGRLLASLKSFEDFPRSAAWIARARKTLLKGGEIA